jgi:hypothetical protein
MRIHLTVLLCSAVNVISSSLNPGESSNVQIPPPSSRPSGHEKKGGLFKSLKWAFGVLNPLKKRVKSPTSVSELAASDFHGPNEGLHSKLPSKVLLLGESTELDNTRNFGTEFSESTDSFSSSSHERDLFYSLKADHICDTAGSIGYIPELGIRAICLRELGTVEFVAERKSERSIDASRKSLSSEDSDAWTRIVVQPVLARVLGFLKLVMETQIVKEFEKTGRPVGTDRKAAFIDFAFDAMDRGDIIRNLPAKQTASFLDELSRTIEEVAMNRYGEDNMAEIIPPAKIAEESSFQVSHVTEDRSPKKLSVLSASLRDQGVQTSSEEMEDAEIIDADLKAEKDGNSETPKKLLVEEEVTDRGGMELERLIANDDITTTNEDTDEYDNDPFEDVMEEDKQYLEELESVYKLGEYVGTSLWEEAVKISQEMVENRFLITFEDDAKEGPSLNIGYPDYYEHAAEEYLASCSEVLIANTEKIARGLAAKYPSTVTVQGARNDISLRINQLSEEMLIIVQMFFIEDILEKVKGWLSKKVLPWLLAHSTSGNLEQELQNALLVNDVTVEKLEKLVVRRTPETSQDIVSGLRRLAYEYIPDLVAKTPVGYQHQREEKHVPIQETKGFEDILSDSFALAEVWGRKFWKKGQALAKEFSSERVGILKNSENGSKPSFVISRKGYITRLGKTFMGKCEKFVADGAGDLASRLASKYSSVVTKEKALEIIKTRGMGKKLALLLLETSQVYFVDDLIAIVKDWLSTAVISYLKQQKKEWTVGDLETKLTRAVNMNHINAQTLESLIVYNSETVERVINSGIKELKTSYIHELANLHATSLN